MTGRAVNGWAQGLLLAGLAGLAALVPVAVQAAGVASFSPQGEVATARQLVVRFDSAVVPFGEPRLPDPMVVACEGATPPGSGRWIDARSWAYDFRQALPPGSRCSVQPRCASNWPNWPDATWRTARSWCWTTPAARCGPGSDRAGRSVTRRRWTACWRAASRARPSSPLSTAWPSSSG